MTISKSTSKAARVTILLAIVLALSGSSAAQTTNIRPHRRVVVSIPDRKLAVIEDGKLLRTFSVAVGAQISPSPTGKFEVVSRIANPTYYHPGVVIPAGSSNPIGPRWIGLNQKGYGIHGTNEPWSIGKAASHGCIRLRNHEIKQLFGMLTVGDTVEIRAERDPEISQLFGGAATATTLARSETPSLDSGGGQQEIFTMWYFKS
jgi:lipoprotein-anchoring transpeptidase ErfK/SrfK